MQLFVLALSQIALDNKDMSENMPTITPGDEYVLRYVDGAADGQTGRRVSHNGRVAEEVTVYASVDGLETALAYRYERFQEVAGQIQAFYRWDQASSDDIEDLADRGEL